MGAVEGEEEVPSEKLVELQMGQSPLIFPVEHHVVSTQSLPSRIINERMKSEEEIKPSDLIRTASHL